MLSESDFVPVADFPYLSIAVLASREKNETTLRLNSKPGDTEGVATSKELVRFSSAWDPVSVLYNVRLPPLTKSGSQSIQILTSI